MKGRLARPGSILWFERLYFAAMAMLLLPGSRRRYAGRPGLHDPERDFS